jgi:hypothetical protein
MYLFDLGRVLTDRTVSLGPPGVFVVPYTETQRVVT